MGEPALPLGGKQGPECLSHHGVQAPWSGLRSCVQKASQNGGLVGGSEEHGSHGDMLSHSLIWEGKGKNA